MQNEKLKRHAVRRAVHEYKKKRDQKWGDGERKHPTERVPFTAPLKVGLWAWRHCP